MSLIEKLQWRYATKKMDASKVVPKEKLEQILDAIRLSASSSGLQPYEVIVVSNKAIREKICTIASNQSQITDCSYLLVFAAWDTYTAYRQNLLKNYPARDPDVNFTHAAKQAYIAVGTALIAAAYQQVDSTPMEGFDPVALDDILNLKERGLRSVVIMPIGYRKADEDWLVNLKKVRRPKDQFVIRIE